MKKPKEKKVTDGQSRTYEFSIVIRGEWDEAVAELEDLLDDPAETVRFTAKDVSD